MFNHLNFIFVVEREVADVVMENASPVVAGHDSHKSLEFNDWKVKVYDNHNIERRRGFILRLGSNQETVNVIGNC